MAESDALNQNANRQQRKYRSSLIAADLQKRRAALVAAGAMEADSGQPIEQMSMADRANLDARYQTLEQSQALPNAPAQGQQAPADISQRANNKVSALAGFAAKSAGAAAALKAARDKLPATSKFKNASETTNLIQGFDNQTVKATRAANKSVQTRASQTQPSSLTPRPMTRAEALMAKSKENEAAFNGMRAKQEKEFYANLKTLSKEDRDAVLQLATRNLQRNEGTKLIDPEQERRVAMTNDSMPKGARFDYMKTWERGKNDGSDPNYRPGTVTGKVVTDASGKVVGTSTFTKAQSDAYDAKPVVNQGAAMPLDMATQQQILKEHPEIGRAGSPENKLFLGEFEKSDRSPKAAMQIASTAKEYANPENIVSTIIAEENKNKGTGKPSAPTFDAITPKTPLENAMVSHATAAPGPFAGLTAAAMTAAANATQAERAQPIIATNESTAAIQEQTKNAELASKAKAGQESAAQAATDKATDATRANLRAKRDLYSAQNPSIPWEMNPERANINRMEETGAAPISQPQPVQNIAPRNMTPAGSPGSAGVPQAGVNPSARLPQPATSAVPNSPAMMPTLDEEARKKALAASKPLTLSFA